MAPTSDPIPIRPAIAVIGPCAAPGCDRPARVHVEVDLGDRQVRGSVCERCAHATRLGVVLLTAGRRPA